MASNESSSMPHPTEIVNNILRLAFFPDGMERPERVYQTIDEDGVIRTTNGVKLFINKVDEDGSDKLLDEPYLRAFKDVEDCLARTLSEVLFVFETHVSLRNFVEKLPHRLGTDPARSQVTMNIELHVTKSLCQHPGFSEWLHKNDRLGEARHGSRAGADVIFARWRNMLPHLPPRTNIALVFDAYWRDYANLWMTSGPPFRRRRNSILFDFTAANRTNVEHKTLHAAQTMAAICDVLIPAESWITAEHLKDLEDHGCMLMDRQP